MISCNILVIEDQPGQISTATGRLKKKLGCTITEARTIDEAERLLDDVKYDLLLVDVAIPRTDNGVEIVFGGVGVIERLQRSEYKQNGADTPYIYLTAQKQSLPQDALRHDRYCRSIVSKLSQHKIVAIVGEYLEEQARSRREACIPDTRDQ